jgi:hypothetical protein
MLRRRLEAVLVPKALDAPLSAERDLARERPSGSTALSVGTGSINAHPQRIIAQRPPAPASRIRTGNR